MGLNCLPHPVAYGEKNKYLYYFGPRYQLLSYISMQNGKERGKVSEKAYQVSLKIVCILQKLVMKIRNGSLNLLAPRFLDIDTEIYQDPVESVEAAFDIDEKSSVSEIVMKIK